MGRSTSLAAVTLLAAGTMALAAPASAQTGYPPGPCTATVTSVDAGTFAVGTVFTVTLSPTCAWTPGTPVNVSVNGQFVGAKGASAAGTVDVLVNIVSPTLLEIDNPVKVPAVCGTNSIVARGVSASAAADVVHTTTFGVNCATKVAAGSGGILAFTGTGLLGTVALAVVLVAAGAVVATSARKRRRLSQPVA
jgi:hypothetical protein